MSNSVSRILAKVPAITLYFWVIKILATTVGETFADFLTTAAGNTFGLGDAQSLQVISVVMGLVLLGVLTAQISTRKYRPWLYWLTVVLVSIAGTQVTDNLHDVMGVELWVTTLVFAALLIAAFAIWYRRERTLAMKSITSVRREVFYWLAVLLTFALGTSAGDQLAESVNLGYGLSLVVFAGAILLVILLWRTKVIGEIAAFWIAYILTRPLGASLGDLLSQSHKDGGLGLGTTTTSIIFLTAILVVVTYLSVTKRDRIAQV